MDTHKSQTTLNWLGLAALVGILAGVGYVSVAPAPAAWSQWPPDYCRGVNCYCEPLALEHWVAQPIATYSNLGFVVVGALVLALSLRGRGSGGRLGQGYGALYGAVLMTTGAFSFFYHASLTQAGNYLDLMGMYLFTSFLLLFNLKRWRGLTSGVFAVSYGMLAATLAVGLWLADSLQQVYFVILIVGLLTAEGLAQRREEPKPNGRWLVGALALFGLGAACWLLDGSGVLPCWPSAPLSWHGLWHLSAAGAAGLIYLYYQSAG